MSRDLGPPTPKGGVGKLMVGSLGFFAVVIVLLMVGSSQGNKTQPPGPELKLGEVYPVKRSMPACPTSNDLSRIMQLVAAKDYDAVTAFIFRQGCVVLQVGWKVAYDGYGGFGVIKVRRQGSPDGLFTPQESLE